VKVEGRLSGFFASEIGLRQGDVISAIFTKSMQMLGFADDIDIIGRNTRAVKDAYSKLEREANRIGLHVNEDKTKFLMVCPSQ
jgi:hypothetical protein